MLMLCFLLGVLLSCLLVGWCARRADPVKLLILGGGVYLGYYVFSAGMLILLGCFLVGTAALLSVILLLASCVVRLIVRKSFRFRIHALRKDHILLAIILAAAAFVSCSQTAGYMGTGQDEGIYQIRAMFYYADRTDDLISFPEYEKVAEEGSKYEKMTYRDELADMLGYKIDEDIEEEEGRIVGILHGLGILPAMMALWGRLFGLRNMNGVITLCYLLSIGNVWLICRNIREERKLFAPLATLMYAGAPLVLWCGQNTLTEIVMTLFLTGCFAVMASPDEEVFQLLSVPFLVGMTSVHIIATVFMPMIVLIYWHAYFVSGKKSFLWSIIGTLIGYGLSFTMMKCCYPRYTDGNYARVYTMTGQLVNGDNILVVVWAAVAVGVILSLIFMLRGERLWLYRAWGDAMESEKAAKVLKIVAVIFAVVTILALAEEFLHCSVIPNAFPRMLISGMVFMSGFVCVPLSIAVFIRKSGELLTDRLFFALVFALFYFMWLYCKLMMPEVPTFYYFARYMAPFLFLPIVLAGYRLSALPKGVLIGGMLALVLLNGWASRLLYLKQDNTYCEYRLIEDITSCIGEKDAVLINEQGYHCERIFAFPIKALSGADVYYVRGSELQKQMDRLDEEYESVFLLSLDTGRLAGEHEGWKVIFRGKAIGGNYEGNQEGILPYPIKWTEVNTPVVMMIKEP
ncbi:MAG: hypothetical protein K6E50_05245 [Lachnospiraceae bacterium]|nr:hypothetical protein [Lachnospiraceae bacterium]